ncbi:hypothetical protein EYR38_007170 [Pleurotus pulmonarius]|nr:hypothetical protein EYR38_007170 [Pleurotus pulmonarius]
MQSCSVVTVPKGVTLSVGSRLNMTGLANKHLNLQGTIKFTPDIPYWTGNAFFIPFQTQVTFWLLGGKNLRVDGGGTLDGSGQIWYDTFASNSSLLRPIVLTLFQATDVVVENINMINGPEWFNLVNEGKNIVYNNLHIDARSTSSHRISNTDGWNIYRSDNVTIQNSVINNGDDCVAFKPNATNVLVSNLQCNGSHGISVGSLGQFPDMFDIVENVLARNVTMTNAQNGARIKAWAGQGVGAGRVKNITFQHFVESKVDNPVVIDQCYMTSASACAQFPSNVFISDIFFNECALPPFPSTYLALNIPSQYIWHVVRLSCGCAVLLPRRSLQRHQRQRLHRQVGFSIFRQLDCEKSNNLDQGSFWHLQINLSERERNRKRSFTIPDMHYYWISDLCINDSPDFRTDPRVPSRS